MWGCLNCIASSVGIDAGLFQTSVDDCSHEDEEDEEGEDDDESSVLKRTKKFRSIPYLLLAFIMVAIVQVLQFQIISEYFTRFLRF